jgi:hypothetical protein
MLDDEDAVIGTPGFYVDITYSLQSDVTTGISEATESRARIGAGQGRAHGRLRHFCPASFRHPVAC